jgi:Putative peptidoglycan binding domain
MRTKRLVFISCLAATALVTSPALGQPPQKKKVVRSSSTPTRVTSSRPTRMISSAPRRTASTQMTPTYRYGGTHYYGGTRYYGGGTSHYYGGYPYYSYYSGGSGYPYYGYSYWPYSYYGDSYPYSYSYYGGPAYGGDVVAAVQRRLAELGYYHRVIDGIMGPQTRAAISAYEATHNLAVDGTISGPLLDRMGLS